VSEIIRIADSKGRVCLPGFANSPVVIEAVSENEYRVRKARVIPEDEFRFPEEDMPLVLSERDAEIFLEALENPPKPNAAARRAAKRFMKKYG
jgi:Protein of unknown function (DUF1778)